MKNLQLTDSEFLLLHDLLDSMLGDGRCVVAAGNFHMSRPGGLNVRLFDSRLIKDVYNKLCVKNG